MYYIGTKIECENYNDIVSQGQNYDGVKTVKWADIKNHYNQDLYAIIAHENYPSELQTIENLDGWYNPNIYV